MMLFALLVASFAFPEIRTLDARKLHLGNDHNDRFADVSREPQGGRYELEFDALRNSSEQVLLIHQRDVSDDWLVELNGKEIGKLAREAKAHELRLTLAKDALRTGKNTLVIRPQKLSDDIIVGDVRIDPRPLREVLRLEPIIIRVGERGGGEIPARIDFVRRDGVRPQLFDVEGDVAMRAGVAYTANGELRAALEPGDYDVFATRGMEWGMGKATVALDGEGTSETAIQIAREIDTTGYIAADTHLHTLTYSGHGDSSVEERLVTLAAQGVELAIATDHNHHTDYRPLQRKMQLDEHFTPVTGNEVTTDAGHFTAFPFDPRTPPPDHKITNFVKLVDDIRAKGAKVIFLNHPRWPKVETGVLANLALDRVTGETNGSQLLSVDGIELVNTNTPLDDSKWMLTDWFALLNAGHRLWGVASSDSHTVGEPVGMGRTYVRSATDDPARIDVDACCAAYREGRFAIAFGIFADFEVNGTSSGGTLTAKTSLAVRGFVRHPSWVRTTRATLHVNGIPVESRELGAYAGPMGQALEFTVPPLPHDAWVVLVAEGDDVTGAWWPAREKYTLGITNPVFVDADGDGQYSSPREIGEAAFERAGGWRGAIDRLDDAAAIQALARALRDANDITKRELNEFAASGAGTRTALASFLSSRLAK
jgi:hypothetical protein